MWTLQAGCTESPSLQINSMYNWTNLTHLTHFFNFVFRTLYLQENLGKE